ncbi:MAG: hypothetical protein LBD23_11705 [Oscillospiraceae bacterium]|jgi:hypothetical protein|nr:hypothetical protein [Oscillospiraceae bacterium]
MGKGGSGSTLIVLVFAVLCLSIFALISYNSARTEYDITASWERLVMEYYEADLLAVYIVDKLILDNGIEDDKLDNETKDIQNIRGVDVETWYDAENTAKKYAFTCDISDLRELIVEIAIYDETYDIMKWQVQNKEEWVPDRNITVIGS